MRNLTIYARMLLLFASISLHAEQPKVTLSVTDQSGNAIQAIPLGRVFQVHVNVATGTQDKADVSIDGIQQFQRLGTSSSSHVMMVNGALTAERSYQYTLRAILPGSFTVGPARARSGSEEGSSETVQLLVDANVQSPPDQKTSRRTTLSHNASQPQSESAILELIPDKKIAYEHQPINITLKLWLDRGVQCSKGLSLPENKYQIKLLGEPKQTNQMRGGKQYQLIEQRFRLVANTAGKIEFPVVDAHCLVPYRSHRLFDIFAPRMQEQIVSSQPFTVEVKKLPANPVPANAVGMFDRFVASIDRTQARVGEGLIYKLTLEGQTDDTETGSFDADAISAPKLQLPDGLTSYASQQEVKQLSPHTWQKSFEFVVQATRSGQFTIPAQQFVYFEPHTEQYFTLKTQPMTLQINELASNDKKSVTASKQDELNPTSLMQKDSSRAHSEFDASRSSVLSLSKDEERKREDDNAIKPIKKYLNQFSLITLLAFGLLIFVLMLLFLTACKKLLTWRRTRTAHAPHRKAFAQAYKQLARLKKNRDVPGLLALITQLFAARADVPVPTVTESWMRDYLQQRNMPEREINDWIREVLYLQRFAYYEHGVGDAQIFERVERWLHELEKWI